MKKQAETQDNINQEHTCRLMRRLAPLHEWPQAFLTLYPVKVVQAGGRQEVSENVEEN